jgi:hypothetical protein
MTNEWTKGEFKPFRVVQKIHLGQIAADVEAGELIQFDGTTIIVKGKEHDYPIIRSVIDKGFFVPTSDTTTTRVTPVTSSAVGRSMQMAASDDHQEVGTIKPQARQASARAESVSVTRTTTNEATTSRKFQGVVEEETEGVPIARIRAPAAVQRPKVSVENAMQVSQQARALDSTEGAPKGSRLERIAYTGDVQETTVGDDWDELLPEAVSSSRPAPGVAGEGDSPHLTAEERATLARLQRRAALEKTETRTETRTALPANPTPSVTSSGLRMPVISGDDDENLTVPGTGGTVMVDVPGMTKNADAAKVAMVRLAVPNFSWDMSRHWKARVKDALDNHANDFLFLNGILAVEIDSVKTHITEALRAKR